MIELRAGEKNFEKQLIGYKKSINDEIEKYSEKTAKETLQKYGKSASIVTGAYLEILNRGGKRVRGALVMCGYEMCGGKDTELTKKVALAIEMMHAYILIIDDIQDRSLTRRDGPTAHVILAEYHHKKDLAGDSEHFGKSMAMNAALFGSHSANSIIADLEIDAATKNKLIEQINKTMMVTAHGQTNDIMNEVVASVSEQDLNNVLLWKTAEYTFLNPLQMGMILAGADESTIKNIQPYAEHAGVAFQISDDILGIFGREFETGKSPVDDIREGKRTILITHALKKTTNGNKNFLIHMLGNKDITPAEFERCKDIIKACGALEYAQKELRVQIEKAVDSLQDLKSSISLEGYDFLAGLAKYLASRTS